MRRRYAARRTELVGLSKRPAGYWLRAPPDPWSPGRGHRSARGVGASALGGARREVALSGVDGATIDRRPRHRRLEPGLPLGQAAFQSDPAVRADADAWNRHLLVAEQARGDHTDGDRVGAGRRLPLRPEPGDRRMGSADLSEALRRDERTLEPLLRLHRERQSKGRVPRDHLVPE